VWGPAVDPGLNATLDVGLHLPLDTLGANP
jgi:hypothetical protein